jgi:hypothetical protein
MIAIAACQQGFERSNQSKVRNVSTVTWPRWITLRYSPGPHSSHLRHGEKRAAI